MPNVLSPKCQRVSDHGTKVCPSNTRLQCWRSRFATCNSMGGDPCNPQQCGEPPHFSDNWNFGPGKQFFVANFVTNRTKKSTPPSFRCLATLSVSVRPPTPLTPLGRPGESQRPPDLPRKQQSRPSPPA